jgi:hypothetical protein
MITTNSPTRIKMRIFFLVLFALSLIMNSALTAQTDTTSSDLNYQSLKSGNTKSMITGSAFATFTYDKDNPVKTNFSATGFSPIFLWKLSDRLFFESELEIAIEDGEVGIDLEYGKISYVLNKYMAVGVGRMISPFGAFGERLEAAFVERFPNGPLLMHHEDGTNAVGPNGAEFGLDVRGGLPLGNLKMNYAVYISNGPSIDHTGALEYENFTDNNSNKAVGGRIGLLPFQNSSFEIGVSGNTGIAGGAEDSLYKDVRATAYAIDLSYVKDLQVLKSRINIKGQYNAVSVDKANYFDEGGSEYTFDNHSEVYYGVLSIRPIMAHSKFLQKLELLARYNSLKYPDAAQWELAGTTTRVDLGVCYWLNWRSGLRLAYEDQKNPDSSNSNQFIIRFVVGL